MLTKSYLPRRPSGVPADDESDVFVALVRSAIILVIMLLPWVYPRHMSSLLQGAAVVAAVYTLALFVARLRRSWLPWQRFFAVCVDLLLITAATVEWPTESRSLFQLYYIVVIVAAMWFGRHGAVAAAVAAIGAYVLSQYATADMPVEGRDIIGLLWDNGAPVLVILALVSSYVLRARDLERGGIERIRHEMELAREMQQRMLPHDLPETEGYDLKVRLKAANEVGGDLYDFVMLDEQTLLLFVADVAGKGVYGMVHVSLLHSHLTAAAKEGLPPAAIANVVNRSVYEELQPYSFASAFIAKLDLSSGRLVYVNCGHLLPLLLRGGATDSIARLSTDTPVIGVTTEPAYVQLSTRLEPDDLLVIVSDGVTETRSRNGAFFGEEGLIETLEGLARASAEEVAETIMGRVKGFAGGQLDDDAIVVVLRRDPVSAESESRPAPGQ